MKLFEIYKLPWYRFGKNVRNTCPVGPIYDYHLRQDLEVNPIQ